jgi:hypothetical protein
MSEGGIQKRGFWVHPGSVRRYKKKAMLLRQFAKMTSAQKVRSRVLINLFPELLVLAYLVEYNFCNADVGVGLLISHWRLVSAA